MKWSLQLRFLFDLQLETSLECQLHFQWILLIQVQEIFFTSKVCNCCPNFDHRLCAFHFKLHFQSFQKLSWQLWCYLMSLQTRTHEEFYPQQAQLFDGSIWDLHFSAKFSQHFSLEHYHYRSRIWMPAMIHWLHVCCLIFQRLHHIQG